jgi:hypothetical protein
MLTRQPCHECGAWDGTRTRTLPFRMAADFKSAVSTDFTTQAHRPPAPWRKKLRTADKKRPRWN